MTLPSYERLGVFYLGREYDARTEQLGEEILYDSRDLTTHAVCIGMTGSGKTGLCVSLLEEAAIDGIPALVIDPKGDIANLALTFPQLRAEDFAPWVDPGEAARKGKSVDEYAAATAETWRKGLAEWNEDGARIERLRAAAEVVIYTPGAQAGRPLSILRSFAAPDAGVANDATALKERIGAAIGGLLALLGIEADPINSREHILLSAILDALWRKGQSPDLAGVIQAVQKPPFDKIGVFDLESFYPAKERMGLALRINGLLASPGFEAWLQGDPLDIQKLLYTATGQPRVAIISIAHLSDAERMFVVTLITNELVAWMRRQSGTTSLRALFYMDEVFGYFPPAAMPPSKLPLLTLMKQARAFGLGVVLATQNPVDLDYKGLGNAGTWFIGRLQTERDKARVIEGLLASDAAGGLDKAGFDALMSNLPTRTFLMRNVHDSAPLLLRTRWALSYLRGPLTLNEITRLTPAAPIASGATQTSGAEPAGTSTRMVGSAGASKPVLQAGVTEHYLPATQSPVQYTARIGARVRARFVDTKAGMDAWESWYCIAPLGTNGPDWARAERISGENLQFTAGPVEGATYGDVPGFALSAREHRSWRSSLEDEVYRNAALNTFRCPSLKMSAAPGGTEAEFRAFLAQTLRERRDAAVDALRRKYATKFDALDERVRRAEMKVDQQKAQATQQTTSAALTAGASLLGALFGSGRRSVFGTAATTARSVSRASKQRADVAAAQADAEAIRTKHAQLSAELEVEVRSLESEFDPDTIRIETTAVKPRKSDITVEEIALVWAPVA